MGIRDRLKNVGRNVAGGVGDMLSGLAEDDSFWKADKSGNLVDPESDERAPGGSVEDSPENAPPPQDPADEDPKSLFWDPFAIIEQLGYKDRPSNITYGTLKAMTWKMPIIQAIIKTRVNQVASFCRPSRNRYDMGFKFIRKGHPEEPLSPAEQKWAEQMETIILRTGVTDNPRGRDSFEKFTRKFMRDSMIYDQGCFEVVPNKKGLPAEWYAVDSATVRLADSASTYLDEDVEDATRYVQIYDGMVITEYTQAELCFGIRNPSTDLRLFGYGTAELEMMVNVVTSLLWAWSYNQKAFSQGSSAKGILNFKGAIPDKQLKQFRRHWYQMLSGIENSFRTPITNADELQWITLQSTNREMEYSAWFDFLIKVACACFDMDPVEVNFKYGNTGQSAGLGGDTHNKEKIAESRDRGLRPLLRYYAECLNRHIIWPINEGMELYFVGLDSMTKDEVSKLNTAKVKSTHMVDELRAEDGMDPLPDGEGQIILDPVFAQMRQAKQQQEMMEQQQDEEGEEDTDFEGMFGEDDGEDEGDQPKEKGGDKPAKPAKPAKPDETEKSMRLLKSRSRKSPQKARRRGKVVVDVNL